MSSFVCIRYGTLFSFLIIFFIFILILGVYSIKASCMYGYVLQKFHFECHSCYFTIILYLNFFIFSSRSNNNFGNLCIIFFLCICLCIAQSITGHMGLIFISYKFHFFIKFRYFLRIFFYYWLKSSTTDSHLSAQMIFILNFVVASHSQIFFLFA